MDQEDQDDIIKKVKEAGNDGDNQDNSQDDSTDDGADSDSGNNDFGGDMGSDQGGSDEDMGDVNEENETHPFIGTTHPWYKNNWDGGRPVHIGNVQQYLKIGATVYNTKGEEKTIKDYNGSYHLLFTDGSEGYFLDWFPQKPMNENFMLPGKGKRMSIFAPEGSDEFMEVNRLDENNEQDLKVGDVVNYEGSKDKWKITNITEPNAIGQVRVFIAAIQADGSLGVKTETNPTRLTLVSNDEINEKAKGLWANIEAKRKRGEAPAKPGDEDYPDKKQWDKLTETHGDMESGESLNYMFWQNLKTIHHASGELLEMNQQQIDDMCANGHAWAVDHISSSADDIEEVYHFFEANINDYNGETEGGYEDEHGSVEGTGLYEGEYDDKPLGKPMKGDVKKFKVYVKNDKGNVIKVNFGDPNMEIKRDNPERKKSFRARHKCSQAKDRTTPKYWSCKMWSSTPVSKIVGEDLIESKKSSIFDKIKTKLNETFNQEKTMSEPMIQPQVNPVVKPAPDKVQPNIAPSRKNKPFLPMPEVTPDPKAIKEGKFDYETYHKTLSNTLDEVRKYVLNRGFDPIEFDINDVQHVAYGHTERFNKELTKNGKPLKNSINVQIYRMDSGTYELNMYIA